MNKTIKSILITGSNSGIGYETALSLAKTGNQIIMVCKDEQKATMAKNNIIDQSNNDNVHLFICNLSIQNDIRKTSAIINAQFDKIDVLINNAGCNFSALNYSEDNIEMQFAVNYLAPFLLTNLLLEKLKNAAQARIINITSRAHARGKINFNDLYFSENYSSMAAYNQSKLATVFFTYELARRLKETNVTVNCIQPGLVNTKIGNKHATRFHNFIWSILKKLGKSPRDAAKDIIYMATSPELNNISGGYFSDRKFKKSSGLSYDNKISEKLWNISEQLTGITYL